MGIRCFVAVELDKPDIRMAFQEIQRRLEATGADIKSVEPENIHITLKFLGNVAEHKVPQIGCLVEDLDFTPLNLEVQGIGVFPNLVHIRVIWAGMRGETDSLIETQNRLDKELTGLDFKPERKRFHPHATLCRVRSGKNKNLLISEIQSMEDYRFGELMVDHLSLKKSVLTPKGPIYTTLAETKR